MRIENWNSSESVFVIAEIGNNHEGDFGRAQEMIERAAQSGADAVKFQTIVPEQLVRSNDEKRIQQLKRFQFSYEQFEALAETAKQHGVVFMSTPFDLKSAAFLNSLVPAFKIASSDNNFYPLISKVAEFGKPILVSAGLADLPQLKKTMEIIHRKWAESSLCDKLPHRSG
jgi:N,N'-diacetyllegionaminate synthase